MFKKTTQQDLLLMLNDKIINLKRPIISFINKLIEK